MNKCLLFDWGGTLMKELPGFKGPMVNWPKVEVIEEAPLVLSELHKNWMLAVATNAVNSNEEQIWAALDRAGLKGFIDKVYCYRAIGQKKPSPQFFSYILNDLGLDASKVFMVGDDFALDVLGANGCGIRAIWLNQNSDEERKAAMYQTVHDLKSLPNALTMMISNKQ